MIRTVKINVSPWIRCPARERQAKKCVYVSESPSNLSCCVFVLFFVLMQMVSPRQSFGVKAHECSCNHYRYDEYLPISPSHRSYNLVLGSHLDVDTTHQPHPAPETLADQPERIMFAYFKALIDKVISSTRENYFNFFPLSSLMLSTAARFIQFLSYLIQPNCCCFSLNPSEKLFKYFSAYFLCLETTLDEKQTSSCSLSVIAVRRKCTRRKAKLFLCIKVFQFVFCLWRGNLLSRNFAKRDGNRLSATMKVFF